MLYLFHTISMKKIILCISIVLCLSGLAYAQKQPAPDTLGAWLDRLFAEQETQRLKSYYTDRATADLCEKWNSCAKWAFEQYSQDQTFKVVKAQMKTMRQVKRHGVTKETHLFIEASYAHRTVRLEFITPKASGRTRPYNYIAKFPTK